MQSFGDAGQIFPYWSFTKTVIAICALKLCEQGRLDLDAPVEGQIFSLRQLLNHTSGLPDYGSLPAYHEAVRRDAPPWPREQLVDAVMAQGTLFAPGEGWSYSNLGHMLALEQIERAAGKPFATVVSQQINAPLGLKTMRLAETRDHFASVPWEGARRYHPGWVYHRCLTGTAAEAARLLHALCLGQILGKHSLAQMMTPVPLGGAIEGRPWTTCGYGLGLMIGELGEGLRAIGHSGAGPFCVNAVYHFPDLAGPVTVASFAAGTDEGVAEVEAVRLAMGR